MISLRLEQMNGNPVAIQINRKPIATLFLWVTRLEVADEFWRSHDTQHQFLDLWDRVNIVHPESAGLYLEALLGSTEVSGNQVTECPRSERVAGVASMCLLHALSGADPKSRVVEDTRQRYIGDIPRKANFEGPFCYTMIAIHAILIHSRECQPFEWMGYKPCAWDHVLFSNSMVQVAYRKRQRGKVPRWVLRFALHSLSQDPPPPTSVVASCLSIIAIDLGCDVSSVESSILNGRCVHI